MRAQEGQVRAVKAEKVSRDSSATNRSELQIAKMSEVHNFDKHELDNLNILHAETTNETTLNVFRELRTRVLAQAGQRNFVCLVTSLWPQGGASYVASNLAAAIALDKSKTSVLVDCNFDAPALDPLLSAEANLGLSDYLSVQEMGIEFVLYASGIKRVRIIPSGKNPSGATEKLASAKMRSFLRELKARYADRFVFVDAPSVESQSADVRILAEVCDFVLLVVPYGKNSEQEIKECLELIGEHRIVGVVFNRP